jgi:cytidylate kinase
MSGVTLGRERPVIAIDGPAGAGKSTLAGYLAKRFGFLNLETGAMYRALALKAIENDADFDSEEELMAMLRRTRIELVPGLSGNRVMLDGYDVTQRVREKDVAEAASRVSVHPLVREWMVDQQRELGREGGVVMEGRDIGTKVFPDAEVKIFLDASPEVRGSRRFQQTTSSDAPVSAPDVEAAAAVLRDLRERDARDRTRANSPLRPAEDAVILDSTSMTLEQVLARAESIVAERMKS